MKILIIDNGARGHAVGASLKRFPGRELFFASGNAGTATIGENLDIPTTNIRALADFALTNKIDLTLPLSEGPLFVGIVDTFKDYGLRIFGPTKSASRLESSKAWAGAISKTARIRMPRFATFSDYDEAVKHVQALHAPCYIKADGPALGKGATDCMTMEKAVQTLQALMIRKKFGTSGETVVIQEYLYGSEYSLHAVCDAKTAIIFPLARDHKRALDGDLGECTGGMGAVAPINAGHTFEYDLKISVVERILELMEQQDVPFRGLLFPGIMATTSGPKVLEFNVRFGDPETEVYMTLLKSDLLDLIDGSIDNRLERVKEEWYPGGAASVIMASGGYPGPYQKGFPITGIEEALKIPGVSVYHDGTAIRDGVLVTNGGRVLAVTAGAESIAKALEIAYRAVDCIHFEGKHFRKDIGHSVTRDGLVKERLLAAGS